MGNLVILSGRLGGDPQFQKSNTGEYASILVITDEGYRDRKTGQWVDQSAGHYLIIPAAMSGMLEYVRKHGQKGRWCEVKTRLLYRDLKKDGQPLGVRVPSLVVSEIVFPVQSDRKNKEQSTPEEFQRGEEHYTD